MIKNNSTQHMPTALREVNKKTARTWIAVENNSSNRTTMLPNMMEYIEKQGVHQTEHERRAERGTCELCGHIVYARIKCDGYGVQYLDFAEHFQTYCPALNGNATLGSGVNWQHTDGIPIAQRFPEPTRRAISEPSSGRMDPGTYPEMTERLKGHLSEHLRDSPPGWVKLPNSMLRKRAVQVDHHGWHTLQRRQEREGPSIKITEAFCRHCGKLVYATLVHRNPQGASASLDFGPNLEFDCPEAPVRTTSIAALMKVYGVM